MPLYRCTAPAGLLDAERRQSVADAFTSIHCELTGAPPSFVHVHFHDASDDEQAPIVLHGGIREGRTDETRAELVRRCVAAVSAILDVPETDIAMRTSTTPASWIFEGGRVLPAPGEEEAWLASEA